MQVSKSVKIQKITRLPKVETVCDITVEDNSNLFICSEISQNPVLVHNCSADVQLLFPIRDAQYKRAELDCYIDGKKKRTFKDAFHRMVLFQMSNNIHDFASMEINGFFTSRSRLRELKKRGGTFDTAMRETLKEMYDTKEVKTANKILLENKGISKGSNTLFDPWFFDINKAEHVRTLFVDVMGLEPPISKKGNMSFGKDFKNMFKETFPIVEMYANITSFKQLKSTFVNKFAEYMDSQQGRITHSIIPDFGFATIVTGRGNSSKPSLMQVPEHGKMAKVIKSVFVTKKGKLKVKMDYSAHEVRCIDLSMYVETSDGKIQLRDLITSSNPPKIKSFNHEKNKIEFRRMMYKSIHTTNEDMLEIEYEGGVIQVTENHEVWSVTRNSYIKAKDIQENEVILLSSRLTWWQVLPKLIKNTLLKLKKFMGLK